MNHRQAGRALYGRMVRAELALAQERGARRRCVLCRLRDWWRRVTA
jgi:hypothetical protein